MFKAAYVGEAGIVYAHTYMLQKRKKKERVIRYQSRTILLKTIKFPTGFHCFTILCFYLYPIIICGEIGGVL